MRQFNYDDNEDFHNDIDGFFEDEEFEDEEFYSKKDIIQAMELELAESGNSVKLLKAAIGIAEKTWFWRFFSMKRKMRLITKAYVTLDKLLTETSQRKEEE